MCSGNGEPFCRQSTAVPNRPTAGQWKIIVEQMNETAFETASDVGGGNVVTALLHALPHTSDGLRGTGEPEVMQFDFVAKFTSADEQADVALAAQRGFQGKCLTPVKALINLCEQQTRSANRTGTGFQRRKSACDFVRVQEAKAFHFGRQKFFGKGGLARAVAAGNQINCWRGRWHYFVAAVYDRRFGSRRRS